MENFIFRTVSSIDGNQNRSKIGEVNSLQVTLRVDRPAPISSEIV